MSFSAGKSKRAQNLKKQREKDKDEVQFQKLKLENQFNIKEIENNFTPKVVATANDIGAEFNVGLVTLDELKAQQELFITKEKEEKEENELKEIPKPLVKMTEKIETGPVSFQFYDDEDEDNDVIVEPVKKKKRYGINPSVQTHMIPDIYRREEENRIREEIKKEWIEKQKQLKNKNIRLPYSYWDGSGHRREITVKRGFSIQTFLMKCLEQLRQEFVDLRSVSVDRLMYVKHEIIIPHHYSFHELSNSVGKENGKLFEFLENTNAELGISPIKILTKDESMDSPDVHDGKVCQRSWYERNKHIFPANRWIPFDPLKNFDNS